MRAVHLVPGARPFDATRLRQIAIRDADTPNGCSLQALQGAVEVQDVLKLDTAGALLQELTIERERRLFLGFVVADPLIDVGIRFGGKVHRCPQHMIKDIITYSSHVGIICSPKLPLACGRKHLLC